MKNPSPAKYLQIKQTLLDRVRNGHYRPYQVIESENELAKFFDVSRVTVRKALDELVNERVLNKQQGRGTFVNGSLKFSDFRCGIGFSSEIRKRGMIPGSKNISVKTIAANEEVAKDLMIPIGAPVWNVTRIRCADDIPIAYNNEYYSKALVPYLDETICKNSIYDTLAEQGVAFEFADQVIDAINCDKETAAMLNIDEGQAIIKMYTIAYMKNGTPFNCGESYYQVQTFKLLQTVYK